MICTYRWARGRLIRFFTAFLGMISMWLLEPLVECIGSAWVSLLVYDAILESVWAWGIVITLLCHEIGHIIAARIVGVRTTLPIFIPFLGAVISLKSPVRQGRSEVAIALGGPALGAIVGLVFLILYFWSQERTYLLWAYLGVQFNLLNLIPCYPLDGGRIGGAVSRYLWWVGAIIMTVGLWLWREPLFFLFIIGAIYRYKQAERMICLPHTHRIWVAGCYSLLCCLLVILTLLIECLITGEF